MAICRFRIEFGLVAELGVSPARIYADLIANANDCITVLAFDGRTALERLRTAPYDLLITDLKMPGVDGLTVIREARRLKTDLPVIIITGFSTEASAIEAVNLGVSGYLTKPFRVPRVLAVAAKALGE